MNINYEYYKIFYYAATYASFSQAAEKLNMNQPNISRTMRKLENELGCVLFVRSNKGVALSEEGEILYEHISAAVEQIEAAESEIRKDHQQERGHLSIGISELSIRVHLMPILVEYRDKHPGIDVRLTIYNSNTQSISALRKGEIDLAIISSEENISANMRQYKLTRSNFTAICGRQYTDLIDHPVHLTELTKYPFITIGKTTSFYREMKKYFEEYNVPFKADVEMASFDQMNNLIFDGMGIAIVPDGFYNEKLNAIMKKIDIIEPFPVMYTCYVKRTDLAQPKYYHDFETMLLNYQDYQPSALSNSVPSIKEYISK